MLTNRVVWLAVIVLLGIAELWWAVGAHSFHDLRVYQGALRFWMDGGDLYKYVMPPENRYGFTYPPLAAILLTPLALPATRIAAVGTIAATVGATVVVASLLTILLPWPIRLRRYQIVGIATLAALGLFATRMTLAEGQINMYMLALVVMDFLVLRGGRWHGLGVGVAAAIKLTPAVFIVYLFLTGRRRAAGTACATFAACGLLGNVVAPYESIEFWTSVLWHTDRVGNAGSASNESIRGLLARTVTGDVTLWWLAAAGLLAIIWWCRVRRAAILGDDIGGLAVTGVFACLVSPITWIHHQVFLIPALAVLTGWALEPRPADVVVNHRPFSSDIRRAVPILVCVVLVIQVNGFAQSKDRLISLIVGNAYVWTALGLFLLLPLRHRNLRPAGPGVSVDAREAMPSNAS